MSPLLARRGIGRRRIGAAIAVAAIVVTATAGTADATIVERGSYADGFEETLEICGLNIHLAVEFSGSYSIREGKNRSDDAFFLSDHYSALDTYTNLDNGKFLTISHDRVFQDIKATRVDGSIFEFVTHEVGQPYVVRDMDGNVVLRDRGAITMTYLFDTLGDDVPGGVWIEDLDLRIAGPHPGWFLTPEDECAGLLALVG
jgi:hypothetical protein